MGEWPLVPVDCRNSVVRMRFENMRPLIGSALLLCCTACTTMKPRTLQQIPELAPECIWVTQSDQSVILLYEPRVVRDTLVGYVGTQRTKLPPAGIQHLHVRESAEGRTMLLATGIVLAFAGVLYAVSGEGSSRAQAPLPGGSGDCLDHPEQPGCGGN
jgi:hypothetical protein